MATAEMIRGMRECRAAFKALPEIAREHFLEAARVTASEIARHAQAKLLSSPSVQTRALHDHVMSKVIKQSGRAIAGVSAGTTTFRVGKRRIRVKGIITAGKGGSALKSEGARIDKPSKRAHFVEFGSRRQPAEPFMIPAAESQEGPYLSRVQAAGRLIERDVANIGMRGL